MTDTEIIGLIALAVGYSNGLMLGWVHMRKPYLKGMK
jgi:hypothetical protein